MVRPHIKYANGIWSPFLKGNIENIEKLKKAIKLIFSLKHLTYKERLQQLKLPTLKYRPARGDMIEVYKIHNDYDANVTVPVNVSLIKNAATRINGLGMHDYIHLLSCCKFV